MSRSCAVGVLAVLLAGCSQVTQVGGPPSPAVSTTVAPSPDAATLMARPLRLPVLAAGSSCPVTPVAQRKVGVTDPRGKGPFYLGGPMPQGRLAFNKMVWVLADGAPGPVLFRGGRLDGAGTLRFSGGRADPGEVSTEPSGQLSTAFFRSVITRGSSDAFYVWPSTTGCYAIQVDAPAFEDVVVMAAS